jgi:hypothetical protein
MHYRDRLNGWAVVRLLPNFQRIVVARFRNAANADGYCRSVARLIPDGKFIVVFDPPDEMGDLSTEVHRKLMSDSNRL